MGIYNRYEILQSFSDLDSHRQTSEIITRHSTNKQDIRHIALESVDFSKVENILDLGCGFGFFILGLKGKIRKGTHIVGLDMQDIYQKPFLDACHKIGATGEFHVSDASELSTYPPHSFDLVLSSFSLYFFPETIGYIAQILTRDGTFVSITHSKDSLRELNRHISHAILSTGIRAPKMLSSQKFLHVFSLENGRKALSPFFGKIKVRSFENKLIFTPKNIGDLKVYLNMKKHVILKEAYENEPKHLEPALTHLMSSLTKEVKKAKRLTLNKNDGIFICSQPLVVEKKSPKPPPIRYCISCGNALHKKVVEGKKRATCPVCGYIAYVNPTPVVSAVVVNDKREVLLIKRERHPMKGMWCLPSGFAEADENIEEAALRELHEEAGIKGRVKRLLAGETVRNYLYGNLVMLSFEVEQTGGRPKAGDDAEDVKYFPLNKMPPLAFSTNEKAVENYLKIYRDKWAIQDSYSEIASKGHDNKARLSDILIQSVEEHATEITRSWLKEVKRSCKTTTYNKFSEAKLKQRAEVVLTHLGDWLKKPRAGRGLEAFYEELGRERKREGFEIPEVLLSFEIFRNKIIEHAHSLIHEDSVMDIYKITEFQMRLIDFFDQAIYHLVKGYDNSRFIVANRRGPILPTL